MRREINNIQIILIVNWRSYVSHLIQIWTEDRLSWAATVK